VRSYTKSIFRTLFSNKGRFLANFIIVFISICITSGLGSMLEVYKESYLKNFDESTPDLIIKLADSNFDLDEKFDEINNEARKEGGFAEEIISFDIEDSENNEISRYYFIDFENNKLAIPKVINEDSTLNDSNTNYIYSLTATNSIKEKEINEKVTFTFSGIGFSFTVKGIVESGLYTSQQQEVARVDSEEEKYVNFIYFVDLNELSGRSKTIFTTYYPTTDILISYSKKDKYFSSSYKEKMEEYKKYYQSNYGENNISVLTLEENTSYALYKNYNKKITSIAILIPFMFILVCALVNSIVITRLIKEERSQIACCSSLGLSKKKITKKYIIFSLFSIGLGALAGYLVGCPLIPQVILPAYNSVFRMNGCRVSFYSLIGIIVVLALLLIGILITIITSINYLKESPASLMKEKAPKPGKKILLEKIPFLWNMFNFSFKSSLRNIFRHKKNFFLTTFAIIGSEILVFVGLSLNDVSKSLVDDVLFKNVASSMSSISFLIIILALGMAITVVYALATMNIQDRNKELATLKVLGYHDIECSMYTFREILIETLIADLFGLPVSTLVTWGALKYIDFGGIEDVRWYTYIASFLIILIATCSVNFILLPRVKKIDMNESLKSID